METYTTSWPTQANPTISTPLTSKKVRVHILKFEVLKSELNVFWVFFPAHLVFSSDHRSDGDLQLCLAGASWTLGLPAVEKQQDNELSVIFLYGDRLRLWIFPRRLRPGSGMFAS